MREDINTESWLFIIILNTKRIKKNINLRA